MLAGANFTIYPLRNCISNIRTVPQELPFSNRFVSFSEITFPLLKFLLTSFELWCYKLGRRGLLDSVKGNVVAAMEHVQNHGNQNWKISRG